MTQPKLIISYQRSQLFVLAQFVMNKSDRSHTLASNPNAISPIRKSKQYGSRKLRYKFFLLTVTGPAASLLMRNMRRATVILWVVGCLISFIENTRNNLYEKLLIYYSCNGLLTSASICVIITPRTSSSMWVISSQNKTIIEKKETTFLCR